MPADKKERVTREIARLRDSVRRKVRDLKLGTQHGRREFETQYGPILEPLKGISEAVKSKASDRGRSPPPPSPPTPDEPLPKVEVKREEEEKEEEEQGFDNDDNEGGDNGGDIASAVARYSGEDDHDDAMMGRELSSNGDDDDDDDDVGDELRTYLDFARTAAKRDVDATYGVHFDGTTWRMGDSPVSFVGDDVVIGGVRYEGTHGLYELLFKRLPDRVYDDTDLNTYKEMLLQTGAHRRHDGTRATRTGRSYKYVNVISKLFPLPKRTRSTTYAYDKVRVMSPAKRASTPLARSGKRERVTPPPTNATAAAATASTTVKKP